MIQTGLSRVLGAGGTSSEAPTQPEGLWRGAGGCGAGECQGEGSGQ